MKPTHNWFTDKWEVEMYGHTHEFYTKLSAELYIAQCIEDYFADPLKCDDYE